MAIKFTAAPSPPCANMSAPEIAKPTWLRFKIRTRRLVGWRSIDFAWTAVRPGGLTGWFGRAAREQGERGGRRSDETYRIGGPTVRS